MFVFKPPFKTPASSILAILFLLMAGVSLAGEKNEPRGYLGVMLQDLNSELAEAMDLENEDGVLVSEVIDDGPAEKAGLQDGDIIIKFDGENLKNYQGLTKAVASSSPGEKVKIVVLRDGKEKSIKVELGERQEKSYAFFSGKTNNPMSPGCLNPDFDQENVFVWHDGDNSEMKIMLNGLLDLDSDHGFMGVELDDINEQMGDYFDVEDGSGALITSVNEDSAAEKAGLKAGDVIVKMDDEDIESAADVHNLMSDTEAEDEIKIKIVRKGKNKTLDITLSDFPEDQMLKHFEVLTSGNHTFDVRSPKMLFHGMPHGQFFPDNLDREIRIISEDDEDLKEMRSELEEMKKELMEMRDELKNK